MPNLFLPIQMACVGYGEDRSISVLGGIFTMGTLFTLGLSLALLYRLATYAYVIFVIIAWLLLRNRWRRKTMVILTITAGVLCLGIFVNNQIYYEYLESLVYIIVEHHPPLQAVVVVDKAKVRETPCLDSIIEDIPKGTQLKVLKTWYKQPGPNTLSGSDRWDRFFVQYTTENGQMKEGWVRREDIKLVEEPEPEDGEDGTNPGETP
ncbi:MAG: hypothetical protein ABIH04_03290 [Planctomycetota bacterium]